MITVKADPSKRVTYGELIGGKRFNVALTGDNIDATTGVAKVKPVQELKIVGQSPQRYDIPAKVDGSLKWAVDVKLPGMVHARNVKPPVAGATLVSIDESSVRSLPGFVKVVSKGNYVAVVCEREEQAIARGAAAEGELAEAGDGAVPGVGRSLHATCARATPTSSSEPSVVGDPDAAFAGAAKVVEADYDVPFQGHTAFGPAHAMADPSNGQMTIYSNDMKSYGMRNGVAQFLEMPRDQRARRLDGGAAGLRPHGGRRCRVRGGVSGEGDRPAGARAVDAATKKPRGTRRARRSRSRCAAALDAQGNLVALDYDARAADYNHVGYNEPDTVLIAQLMGMRRGDAGGRQRGDAVGHVRHPEPAHGRARRRACRWSGRRRCAPATCAIRTARRSTFAAESFIDELAAAAKADPVAFRLKLLHGEHRRRQRLQARAIDRRAQGGGRGVRLGPAAVAEAASAPATSSPAAASPTRSAARPSSREIAEVEVNRRPAASG